MKCALASMGFIDEDVHHNKNVIIETMKRYAKDADISRFLDALEKRYKEEHQLMANALSFGDYGKAGGSHV